MYRFLDLSGDYVITGTVRQGCAPSAGLPVGVELGLWVG